jgi:hypothetical protein
VELDTIIILTGAVNLAFPINTMMVLNVFANITNDGMDLNANKIVPWGSTINQAGALHASHMRFGMHQGNLAALSARQVIAILLKTVASTVLRTNSGMASTVSVHFISSTTVLVVVSTTVLLGNFMMDIIARTARIISCMILTLKPVAISVARGKSIFQTEVA